MNEYFRCPICKNSNLLRRIPRKVGGFVAECAGCGHLTLWPQPREQEMDLWYIHCDLKDSTRDGDAIFDDLELNLLEKYDKRRRLSVLDAGCGRGNFLKKCAKKGHHVAGVDICKNFVDSLVSEGFEVYHKSLEELSDTKQKYDWVVCMDVLEHIKEPIQAIEILSHLVKVNGLLLITSPNGDAIARYGKNTHALCVDAAHLNYFRPNQLIKLLENHGLSLVCKKFYPKSLGLGRAGLLRRKSDDFNRSLDIQRHGGVKGKEAGRKGIIREVVEKLPPNFRGLVRSVAQVTRRITALDEIVRGIAHEFVIIMIRPK